MWYYHPESNCAFETQHPLGMESFDACLCEEITEEEARRIMAKEPKQTSPAQSLDSTPGHLIEGTAERIAEEAFQVRDAIGDPAAASSLPVTATVEDERLVKIYVKIRDAKSEFNAAYKAELESKYDSALRQISTELKKRLQARTNEGLKTSYGTVYLAEEMKVSCQDWGIFYDWIKKNDALDMLEQRVKAGEVKNYMESHNGELPPGLSVFRETEARVRKPKTPSSNAGRAPDPAGEQ